MARDVFQLGVSIWHPYLAHLIEAGKQIKINLLKKALVLISALKMKWQNLESCQSESDVLNNFGVKWMHANTHLDVFLQNCGALDFMPSTHNNIR